jgi:hypothetical protein
VEVNAGSGAESGDLIVEVYESGGFPAGDAPFARAEDSISKGDTVVAVPEPVRSFNADLSSTWYGVNGTQYDLVVFVDTNDNDIFDAGTDWRFRVMPESFTQDGDYVFAETLGDGTVDYNSDTSGGGDFSQDPWSDE